MTQYVFQPEIDTEDDSETESESALDDSSIFDVSVGTIHCNELFVGNPDIWIISKIAL
eukprot:m.158355 g.158355  ORF g.158355 m.158355 type:complete len:58 (+) comp38734_c1_seq20:97-270(+)